MSEEIESAKIFKGREAESNGAPQASGFGIKNKPNGLPESVETTVVTFDRANGNLQIAGKIEDQILMYGMLLGAIFLVFQYGLNKQKNVPEKINQ